MVIWFLLKYFLLLLELLHFDAWMRQSPMWNENRNDLSLNLREMTIQRHGIMYSGCYKNPNAVDKASIACMHNPPEGVFFDWIEYHRRDEIADNAVFVVVDVNDIYPEVSTLKDPELQSAQLAARARFLPDYTVRAATNIEYLRITAEHYLLARRLTVWVTKLHPQGEFGINTLCFGHLGLLKSLHGL